MLTPHFLSRAFSPRLQPALSFQLSTCSYSALGGPKSARLVARSARAPDLDELASLLRCPIELYTAAGRLSWWGLVRSVTVQDGAVSAQITLDDLANRVQVAYADMQPSASGAGTRQTTPWQDDLTSQAVYGLKETQLSLSLATQSQAEAFRATFLAASSKPTVRAGGCRGEAAPRPGLSSGPYGRLITLDCCGWWETLAWRYYAAPALTIENFNQVPAWQWDFGFNVDHVQQIAQQITISNTGWYAGTVWLPLHRLAVVSSNVAVDLCADNAGIPGTVLASAVSPGSTLPVNSFRWVKFILSPGVILAPGTYWLRLSDSAPSGGFKLAVQVDEGKHFAGGVAKASNNASWFTVSPDADFQFRLGFCLETTEQIRAMVSSAGQFLAGLRLEAASGLYTNPFRAGDSTALEEITHHLAAGTVAGLPLTAEVTPERVLAIKTKADPSGSALKIGRDGILRLPNGTPATPGPNLAGAWATLDVPWATAASWGLTPGRIYLENVAYDGSTGWVRPISAIS